MKTNCQNIRDTLATDGPQALRHDEKAQQHLAECEECFAFLDTLSEVETGLQAMPQIDASDDVVASLLARPELATSPRRSRWQRLATFMTQPLRPRPMVWGSAVGALFLVVIGVGLMRTSPQDESNFDLASLKDSIEEIDDRRDNEVPAEEIPQSTIEALRALGYVGEGEESETEKKIIARRVAEAIEELERREGVVGQSHREQVAGDKQESRQRETQFGDEFRADQPVPGRFYENVPTAPEDPDGDDNSNVHGSRSRDFQSVVGSVSNVDPETGQLRAGADGKGKLDAELSKQSPDSLEELDAITGGAGVKQNRRASTKPKTAEPPPSGPLMAGQGPVGTPVLIENTRIRPEYPAAARNAGIEARVVLQAFIRTDGSVTEVEVLKCDRPGMGFEEAAVEAVEQWRYEPARQDGKPVDVYYTIVVDFDLDDPPADDSSLSIDTENAVLAARAFLDGRETSEGLSFKSATGYWRNTYVPGDPATRLLQARLAGWDRSVLQSFTASTPRLHEASRGIGQPFDTPEASAIAVYLHADRRGVTGESRMLLQVGLEGTPRHGGRRPAMNLALVLDLRDEISSETAHGVRALIEAFNRAKEPGDRFRIFAAGKPGGLVVEPRDFRHGFLKVSLDRLISGVSASDRPALGIVDAVSAAITSVAAADDADAPLGSSAVILVSGRPFGDAARKIAALAHQGAVAGVPLSVVGIGAELDPSEIELVTLAGQGNRRMLDSPAAAADLVDRELSAVSRAIARAVRLRVRLAPGVKLIDVLGSERLDEKRAQRVRDAEKSIDLRLSRNLGIEADRGEDEEGIQIVIPSFYADDSHVILLDVVAPGPGPVAEVTVRYKDLVHLRNGVSRASLDLGRDARPVGPLERNVLKNLLSFRLSWTLDRAGQALNRSDTSDAAALLDGFAELLRGLRHEVPGLSNDPEVLGDLAMLGEYRTLLAGGFAASPDRRDFLADSLCYAARLKIQPRPLEIPS